MLSIMSGEDLKSIGRVDSARAAYVVHEAVI